MIILNSKQIILTIGNKNNPETILNTNTKTKIKMNFNKRVNKIFLISSNFNKYNKSIKLII